MQEENLRLVDEALEYAPIKNTFRLAWEFIQINKKFTLTSILVFVVLNLLATAPMVGFIFIILAGVFGFIVQIHVGKIFYTTSTITTYVNEIQESTTEAMSKTSLQPAFGAYLGWIAFIFISLILLSIVGTSMGILHEGMTQTDMLLALANLGVPFLLFALVLSYVQPLVQSNIILAQDFKQGFKAVFSIFSVTVWRSAFKKSYFNYVALLGLVIVVGVFALVAFITLFSMIPLLNILVNIFALAMFYVVMVITAIASMMARRLVEV